MMQHRCGQSIEFILIIETPIVRKILFRKISPDVLPSCSPGVFRQKSFSSFIPPQAKTFTPTTVALGVSALQNSQGTPVIVTSNCCDSHVTTPTIVAITTVSAASPRDGELLVAGSASLPLSRGSRTASKHTHLDPALASKMASASSSTVVQGWPNTKDDYELKEVIGE